MSSIRGTSCLKSTPSYQAKRLKSLAVHVTCDFVRASVLLHGEISGSFEDAVVAFLLDCSVRLRA
eukprot:m.186113 g.186113  ORF g.186113 m.186113 type:complete len:65 (-) comp14749_c0_seq2:995-1189(-)